MRALFFSLSSYGHIAPTLPVVTELARRGVDVVFRTGSAHRERIEAAGATFRPLDIGFGPAGRRRGGALAVATALLGASARALPELVADSRRQRPDVVVFDSMAVWGKHLARSLRIPAASSCPAFLIDYGARLPAEARTSSDGPPRRPSLVARLRYRALAAYVQARFGAETPTVQAFFTNPGDRTLVYTSRAFTPRAERFGAAYEFVGASIGERGDAGDFPLEALAGRRVIYVAIGTILTNPALLRACVEAFGGSHDVVVLSTGQTGADALGTLPGNVIARPFVPQIDVLARASLFVTHCGMNSVTEALWHGVPMIAVPHTFEERHIAARVQELGAGVLLAQHGVTVDALRVAAERVLEQPSFRAASEALGRTLREAGGPSRAADVVMKVAAGPAAA